MKTRMVVMVLACTGLAMDARAQSVSRYTDSQNGLSVDAAVKRAIEREPSLRAVRAELDASKGMRLQAGLRPNPSLSLERREEPAGMDNQTTVGVSLPLDLRRRGARITVADREIEVAQHGVDDRIRVLVTDVRMRYGQAAAAARDAEIADQLASSARRQLDLVRQRVEQGASPPLERDLLDVELRRFESERLLTAARADAAMFELRRVLGFTPETPLLLREPLEALVPAPPPTMSADLAQRADVLEAEARLRLAEARIQRARTEGRIDLSVFASYMRMNAGFPQRGFGEGGQIEPIRGIFHYVAGGAIVMVPLWNRNDGQIAAAQAERAAAEARFDAAQLSARAELASAMTYVTHAASAAAVIADGVALARKNFEVVRQMYELGRATLPEILVEQRRYLEMENAYTAALREAFEARTSLAFAQGELP